jgi:3,4-dihydroxy 2-butanone 4-phosphate synthase/GTP cyclohydrolase II
LSSTIYTKLDAITLTKLQQLQAWGLVVVERVPLAVPANAFSHAYLTTKLEKLGHWL